VTRTAIVTGGTSGIGLATTRTLVRDGWWVLATGLSPDDELASELAAAERGAVQVVDLTAPGAAQQVVDSVLARRQRLDLLVNNAGVHALATVAETDESMLDRILALNVRAATLLAGAAVRAMRSSSGGVIVNVGSEAGVVAIPDQAAYNISKAAIAMLTRSIAVDHASDGIRAVTVSPGTTRTPLVRQAIESAADPVAHERMLSEKRPARRLGEPEEIAELIAFIAGGRVTYMTGCEIVVDGGYTAQ
jgi:NAD(P)-dependent dehydrogenase (short-subunit alcohol dehydrogenase family)